MTNSELQGLLGAHADGLTAALERQHLLLTGIYHELRRRSVRFGTVTTNSGGMLVAENKRGVVRCITNPTAAALQVTLYDGANGGHGVPDFNASLNAGESRLVFVTFHSGLVSFGGPGATVDGELDS